MGAEGAAGVPAADRLICRRAVWAVAGVGAIAARASGEGGQIFPAAWARRLACTAGVDPGAGRLAVGRLGSGPWADQCLVAQMEWAAVAGTGGMGGTATWGLRTGEPEGLTWET